MKNLILIFTLVILASCDHVHVGTVVDKYIEPSRYYTSTYFTRVGKVSVPHTVRHWDDEDYVVVVRGVDDGGDTVNESYYVSWQEYQHIGIGYCFNDTIDRVFQDCQTGEGDW